MLFPQSYREYVINRRKDGAARFPLLSETKRDSNPITMSLQPKATSTDLSEDRVRKLRTLNDIVSYPGAWLARRFLRVTSFFSPRKPTPVLRVEVQHAPYRVPRRQRGSSVGHTNNKQTKETAEEK